MAKMISNEQTASFLLELSLLLHAGVATADALDLLAQESEGQRKQWLADMAKDVDGGTPLSGALRQSGRLPVYVCGLVEMGEESGRVEEALTALSNYYESRARMDRRIKSALLYPAIMLSLMLLVIGVLLVKVLPIFDDVYGSLGGQLTGVAAGLLGLGRWLDGAMPVLWGLLILAALLAAAISLIQPFKERVLLLWRRVRGDKGIYRKMNNARLAQALAMGVASGLPLEQSLTLAAGLIDDVPGAKARCADCQSRVENGETMWAALKASGVLPAGACRLLELGQRSGTVDSAMAKIAADLEEQSESALEDMVSRVEPALVLVCSILVGLILLSVMLPLMHIMSAIG